MEGDKGPVLFPPRGKYNSITFPPIHHIP